MKKIVLLGATGSIGKATLNIIRKHSDHFKLCGASCYQNDKLLAKIGKEFNTNKLALAGKKESTYPIQYFGKKGILQLIEESKPDIVLNGISGSAGLEPSIKAIECKIDLALANKETLVMAGPLINKMVKKNKINLLPVDSEHAAIFELIKNHPLSEIKEIWLTASGGPFKTRPIETFPEIKLEEALKHPTWKMGKKITIDSATMANKGLELIEAVQLFNIDPHQIKVAIHPTSQVHSMIQTIEGSFYAQISEPDMQLPILNALSFPKKINSDTGKFDLFNTSLNFSDPDLNRYPMLKIAYHAAEIEGEAPIIYNAANEAAVLNFINKKIQFTDIPKIVKKAIEKAKNKEVNNIEEILAIHNETWKNCILL